MSGLVAHYPLNEWNRYGNNTEAVDLSGNGNHGSINSSTPGGWGVGGLTSYTFIQSGSGVTASVVPEAKVTESFSVSAWIRSNTQSNIVHHIQNGSNASDGIWNLTIKNGELGWQVFDGTAYGNSIPVSNYTWYHIVGTWDPSTKTALLYVNGSAKTSGGPPSIGVSNTGLFIGTSNDGNPFDGSICDVRIYNRVLSPQEIQKLYEWGSEDYTPQHLHDGTDSGAVSRYEFESGALTADSWGNNTLTDNTSAGTSTDSIRGQSKVFDGTDDYMTVGSFMFDTDTWTFSSWHKVPKDLNTAYAVFDTLDDTKPRVALYYNSGGALQTYLGDTNGNNISNSAKDFAFKGNHWQNFVVRRDGKDVYLFVDGASMSLVSNTNLESDLSAKLNLGESRQNGGQNFLKGKMGDIRFYDRALSDREIFELYRWGTGGRDMRKLMVNK